MIPASRALQMIRSHLLEAGLEHVVELVLAHAVEDPRWRELLLADLHAALPWPASVEEASQVLEKFPPPKDEPREDPDLSERPAASTDREDDVEDEDELDSPADEDADVDEDELDSPADEDADVDEDDEEFQDGEGPPAVEDAAASSPAAPDVEAEGRAALLRLYEEGLGEQLLPLLRTYIASPRSSPFRTLEHRRKEADAYEIALWVLSDLGWSRSACLAWLGETQLVTRYAWEHVCRTFVPTPREWSDYADTLLARLTSHVPRWNDRLVEHTADVLCKAGRLDDAYALYIQHAPVTGHWYRAVFILRDQPREWQRAFAGPLRDAIRRWDGPESVREFALRLIEDYLGKSMGRSRRPQ